MHTNPSAKLRRSYWQGRSGAAHILIAIMLLAFVVTAALTIDFSYMQLVRTELRTATDAAAKAGAEALVRTQSRDQAVAAAVNYANRNMVAGRPYKIRTTDVHVGRVTQVGNGPFVFTDNQQPFNAVRVESRLDANSLHGPVQTFFGPAFGHTQFVTSSDATAAQQEVEVVLCLDRSGSMLFDMTGTEYSYPSGNPLLSSFTAWGTTWRYHLSPPHPTNSRWAKLSGAIDVFLSEVDLMTYKPRTGLVTWGSDYTMPIAPSTFFPKTQIDFNLPASASFNWTTNRSSIKSAISARTTKPMMGGTNLSAGLDQAVTVLQGANARPLSNKVIILLTDGQWNDGRDPQLSANDARNAGITVHTVSMLTASQPILQDIANTTGGRYYMTSNDAQLRAAFQELARSLPVVLTE
jgi:Ca-activated chloride channel family protein